MSELHIPFVSVGAASLSGGGSLLSRMTAPTSVGPEKFISFQAALAEASEEIDEDSIPDVSSPDGVTPRGTTVSMITSGAGKKPEAIRLSRDDGTSLHLEVRGNMRITEGDDGSISVYYGDGDKTVTYKADGSWTEARGDTAAGPGHAIHINLTGAEVVAGDLGSIIYNYADNARIIGGLGDDLIILGNNVSGLDIDCGGGNDTVRGKNITDSAINLGEGNNTLDCAGLVECVVTGGNGNNTINANWVCDSNITLGDGNNSLAIQLLDGASVILLGNGTNTLEVESVRSGGKNDGQPGIRLGDGNNTVTIKELEEGCEFVYGSGANKIFVGESREDYVLPVNAIIPPDRFNTP